LIFERIFYVDVTQGHAIPPPTMEQWVVRQFGAVAAVREQTIVKITNRLTLESALLNPLRARRPSRSAGGDAELEAWIARELAEHDSFRDPERDTTADLFGRIRGRHCVTASNIAKYEGWHGLVIFDEPHPLRFSPDQVSDYLAAALRWIEAAHAHSPQAIYPIITWNCLPKSGATLMHGHMQVALAANMHYAHVERWRRAATAYRAETGTNYFDDLYAIHQALGLALGSEESTRTFAYLAPARNREVVILTNEGSGERAKSPATLATTRLEQLAETLSTILRILIDKLGVRAFNLAIALPPIEDTAEDWRDMPIVARIADRGDPLTTRSDMGAMELFAANVITADPFDVAAQLRSVDKK
jgi:galactose-1-phosphate uridylyltransferase